MSDPNEPVFRMDPSTFRVQESGTAEAIDTDAAADDDNKTAAGDVPATVPPTVRRGRRPVRWADVIVSIVLLVVLIGAAVTASVFGAFLSYASRSCDPAGCNYDVLSTGVWFAVLSPWAVAIVAIAGSVVLMVLRRLSFWVPLTAFALMVALWLVGAVLVWAGS